MRTKRGKGNPCQIEADRFVDGKHYCHLHDPSGTFQQDLAANRFIKNAEKDGHPDSTPFVEGSHKKPYQQPRKEHDPGVFMPREIVLNGMLYRRVD
tara:strand:+ start:409151 stop:409438 length:288 start_codon:yes stop_codon:yes gene_type:complete